MNSILPFCFFLKKEGKRKEKKNLCKYLLVNTDNLSVRIYKPRSNNSCFQWGIREAETEVWVIFAAYIFSYLLIFESWMQTIFKKRLFLKSWITGKSWWRETELGEKEGEKAAVAWICYYCWYLGRKLGHKRIHMTVWRSVQIQQTHRLFIITCLLPFVMCSEWQVGVAWSQGEKWPLIIQGGHEIPRGL